MNDLSNLDISCAEYNFYAGLSGTNGPELWAQILAPLPAGSVIAGGAIRDYQLGREPKDIDVFVPADGFPGINGFEPLGDDRREEYGAMNQIAIVQRGEIAGYQVDMVGLDPWPASPVDLVGGFDFGLNRCWFGVVQEIRQTLPAYGDMRDRTVTMLLGDRLERSRARFQRFNERMGGEWRLVEAYLELREQGT